MSASAHGGEPRAPAHRARASPDAERLLERLLRQARSRRGWRTARGRSHRRSRSIAARDLQPGPGLVGIQLQVREAAPALPVGVEPRLVLGDQPGLQDERLELAAGRRAPRSRDRRRPGPAPSCARRRRSRTSRARAGRSPCRRRGPGRRGPGTGRRREPAGGPRASAILPKFGRPRAQHAWNELAERLDAEVLADVEQALSGPRRSPRASASARWVGCVARAEVPRRASRAGRSGRRATPRAARASRCTPRAPARRGSRGGAGSR